jgi:hypothetical protein
MLLLQQSREVLHEKQLNLEQNMGEVRLNMEDIGISIK